MCSIQWLKFLAWEEFDEEIWGEGLRPAYIENSIKFTPQFLVTLNSKLMIKTVSSFIRCLQFNHVYQYLLNNVSFGISTYVCICFSTFEDGEAWYRVSTVELEVKARFQPFPFLLLWTDGNFFPHSFTNLYLIQRYIKSPAIVYG